MQTHLMQWHLCTLHFTHGIHKVFQTKMLKKKKNLECSFRSLLTSRGEGSTCLYITSEWDIHQLECALALSSAKARMIDKQKLFYG